MAYLGKGKKDDLRTLALELGENVSSDMRVVEIRDVILASKNYDESFVKELLSTIISERVEKKEQEEKEKERCKDEQQKEKEREEKEKEREEKEKERAFELEKHRLEIELRTTSSENGSTRSTETFSKIELQKIVPKFNAKSDDISLFLELFERQAKVLQVPPEKWVTQLIGVLPPEISHLIAREPEEQAREYEYVKSLLLKRFKLSPEKFRQLFVKLQKSVDKTWHAFFDGLE